MNKLVFHDGHIEIDTAITINYDLKELMTGIANEISTISWAVMGREVKGAVFVSVDEANDGKLVTHGSMIRQEFVGEAITQHDYLWVVVDKLDAAYRARFLTPDSINTISKDDFVRQPSSEEVMELAHNILKKTASVSFKQGVMVGMLMSLAVLVLAHFIIAPLLG